MENLLHEAKTVIVEGKEVQIKRLSFGNVFQVVKILKKANIIGEFRKILNEVGGAPEFTPLTVDQISQLTDEEQAVYAERLEAWKAGAEQREAERADTMVQTALNLLFSVTEAENEVYDLIGSFVKVKGDKAKDFDLELVYDILHAVLTAPDLKAFFDKVSNLLPEMPKDRLAAVAK